MDSTDKIWFNGKLVGWDDAKIHVLSHTLHYGSGAFEGIRFYDTAKGPAIFRLKEHIDRLFDSASVFRMPLKYSKEEIIDACIQVVRENSISSGYIRPIFFFGYGKMGLNPDGCPVDYVVAEWPWGAYLGDKAVKVKVSSYMRIHPRSTNASAKICGHYVNSILANIEAKEAGYDEALLLDYRGFAAEGPGENLFIIRDKIIYTPLLDVEHDSRKYGSILPGITRDAVIKVASGLGYKVVEKDISIEEVKQADEAFFTGTAAEVTAIGQIDDTEIASGPITSEIRKKFFDIVEGRNEEYSEWLTYVN